MKIAAVVTRDDQIECVTSCMRRRLDMLPEPVGEQDISESNGTGVVNDVGVDVEIPYNNETTIRSRRCFDRPFELYVLYVKP